MLSDTDDDPERSPAGMDSKGRITDMISKTMQDALNAQINIEQYSAQLYLAMSAHCEVKSFKGFAHWLRVQAGEETAHAVKLIDFLLDRGGRLELQPIPAPRTEFGSILQVFEQTLAHEKNITGKISALFAAARDEKDYASEITLQWYVTEQVEEEATISQIVDHLRAVGDQGGGIWYLDSKMGKRGKA
jgi:ferritin